MPLSCLVFSWFNKNVIYVEWIGIGVRKYLTKYFSSCPHVLSCFAGVFLHCMPWSFSGKRWLLTCIEHTRRLTHMQHTKHYLRASYYRTAHKLLLACSTQKIACMKYTKDDSRAAHFVSTRVFWLESQKLKNTCMFTARECHAT